ncbi:SUMF1/EgtB/PvdO family nonheme iron enzyme, partial [Salmonella sp. SAL4431]|uniref:SUMF1/EgtB/PvdO family nonheme iron enzyme n=1 Tax=Salmonella sp. SAL4431 TaxID=3159886 RepID=UPI00397DB238
VPELADCRVRAAFPPEELLFSALPSEAQWDYAARGATPQRYPWGDAPPTADQARVARHTIGTPYDATSLPAAGVADRLGLSPFGLHH